MTLDDGVGYCFCGCGREVSGEQARASTNGADVARIREALYMRNYSLARRGWKSRAPAPTLEITPADQAKLQKLLADCDDFTEALILRAHEDASAEPDPDDLSQWFREARRVLDAVTPSTPSRGGSYCFCGCGRKVRGDLKRASDKGADVARIREALYPPKQAIQLASKTRASQDAAIPGDVSRQARMQKLLDDCDQHTLVFMIRTHDVVAAEPDPTILAQWFRDARQFVESLGVEVPRSVRHTPSTAIGSWVDARLAKTKTAEFQRQKLERFKMRPLPVYITNNQDGAANRHVSGLLQLLWGQPEGSADTVRLTTIFTTTGARLLARKHIDWLAEKAGRPDIPRALKSLRARPPSPPDPALASPGLLGKDDRRLGMVGLFNVPVDEIRCVSIATDKAGQIVGTRIHANGQDWNLILNKSHGTYFGRELVASIELIIPDTKSNKPLAVRELREAHEQREANKGALDLWIAAVPTLFNPSE